MSNKLYFAIGFAIGSAIGLGVLKFVYEKKANAKVQAEIDAIREDNNKKAKELAKKNEVKPQPEDLYAESMQRLADLREASKIAKENGYIPEVEAIEEEEEELDGIFRINVEEFSQLNGLQKETLTWYKDRVLADEEYEVVTIKDTVGMDAIDALMASNEEAIYLRNLRTGCEYELIYEPRSYFDVTGIYYGESRE